MEKKKLSLQVVNLHAAGIDVGSRSHVVAVDQNKENVRSFGVYTKDHGHLIKYLTDHGITSVAMESTGSYWQTLFSSLQRAGFEVILVAGSQTKNVQGRKTDVIDAIWIQKLHSLGLLSGSFLLSDVLQELRTYYNHREYLIEQLARYNCKTDWKSIYKVKIIKGWLVLYHNRQAANLIKPTSADEENIEALKSFLKNGNFKATLKW